jgi:hypothetical protein
MTPIRTIALSTTLTLFTVLSTACLGEPSVTDAHGPNGEAAHVIRCRETEACYQKAVDICDHGYSLHSTAISAKAGSEILVSCND